jgi:hypothetical protein
MNYYHMSQQAIGDQQYLPELTGMTVPAETTVRATIISTANELRRDMRGVLIPAATTITLATDTTTLRSINTMQALIVQGIRRQSGEGVEHVCGFGEADRL